jgi:hypothetical protein
MIRTLLSSSVLALALGLLGPHPARAQHDDATKKKLLAKVAAKDRPEAKASDDKGGAKPLLVGTYGDWGAYETQSGKNRICYALAKPKDRQPSNLTRDPAYVFIATRPSEGVHNEISVILGFPVREGPIEGGAEIEGAKFDLIAKGEDAWIKNAADEGQVIDAMRKGLHLIVRAPSKRGKVTTDSYSLSGLTQALDRVAKSCP